MMSPCGVECSICKLYPAECAGCSAIQGKAFWTAYVSEDVCSIYDCVVNEKKLKHCGSCSELPCRRYFDTRDPSYPEEEHIADTNRRAALLKELNEKEIKTEIKEEKKGKN